MKSLKHILFSSSFLSIFLGTIFLFLFKFSSTAQENKTKIYRQNSKITEAFSIRGFHIDLRIQRMTMPALKNFAKELSDFGINTIVMEWEASFPYSKHATISNKYSYTREQVKDFISYCDNLGIEVIPLQQCFGHVEYILQHSRYKKLRESEKDISQVCPLEIEGNKDLFTDLFKDMISLHKSKYIHIGGDETRLLGYCPKCSAKAEAEGKSKLFADYLAMICKIVTDEGKVPVVWADIVLKYPETVNQLPKETIFVDWNYGWDINYFGNIDKLLEKGSNFWGAPSIRSHPDNWYTTDWQKHFNNQRDFIPYARKSGYKGIVMTSWSTSGVYGFTWDTNNEVIDMHAIRNVYPLSGFRILIAAYAQSLKQTSPINPESFVIQYAQNRFGFSNSEGKKLWRILTTSPKTIKIGDKKDIATLNTVQKEVKEAQKIMCSLKPKSHRHEFEHLRLMIDLRLFYLNFKKVESVYESDQYNRETAKEILPELKKLVKQSRNLNKRFAILNKGFLYPEEIEEQNNIRNKKLINIFEIVNNETKKDN